MDEQDNNFWHTRKSLKTKNRKENNNNKSRD